MKRYGLFFVTASAFAILILFSAAEFSEADEANTVIKPGLLESINRDKSSLDEPPMCGDGVKWGTTAVFKRPGRNPKVISLELFQNGDLLIAEDEDDKGYAVRLAADDYGRVVWRKKLESEHVQSLILDPTGRTFVVLYRTSRSKVYHFEIRSASTGSIIHEIIDGIEDDCESEGGFSAFNGVYSNDGKLLAINYQNSGGQCTKIKMQTYIGLIDVNSGEVLRRAFYQQDAWDDFGRNYNPIWLHLAFDRNSRYLYIGSLGTFIFRYPVDTMKNPWFRSFFKESEALCPDAATEIQSMIMDRDGSLIYTMGGQGIGDLFRLSADLKTVTFLGTNEGASFVHTAYSSDRSVFMANRGSFNIWDMNTKRFLLYGYGADANIARFHPLKRAVIHGSGPFIAVVSEMHYSQKQIGTGYTSTGHYLTAFTDYTARGPGKIWWAYGKTKFDDPDYYKKESLGSDMFTFGGRIGNDDELLKGPAELKLKTSSPGQFTVCGGTAKSLSASEVIKNLPSWK